ncbi:MAG: hypothetical protein ACT4P7_08900 [Gemmatimonadaceae bacterium]
MLPALRRVGMRVVREWASLGHKEAYVMARKEMSGMSDLRPAAPASFSDALAMDDDA